MTDLEKLQELYKLLQEQEEYIDIIKEDKRTLDKFAKLDGKYYKDDYSYAKKIRSLQKIFFVLSIIVSLVGLYLFAIPLYEQLLPDQSVYIYYQTVMIIVVAIMFLFTIFLQLRNLKNKKDMSLKKYINESVSPIALFILVGIMGAVIGVVLSIVGAVFTFSDAYEVKVNEIFNISLFQTVMGTAFGLGTGLVMIVFFPITILLSKILPNFIVLRKRIDSGYKDARKKYNNDLPYYQAKLESIQKEIDKNDVVVKKFKHKYFIKLMLDVYEREPNSSLRYVLNQVILEEQANTYQIWTDSRIKEANQEIENSQEQLKYENMEYRAYYNAYKKTVRDNNMRLAYLRDKQVDEIVKYARNRRK